MGPKAHSNGGRALHLQLDKARPRALYPQTSVVTCITSCVSQVSSQEVPVPVTAPPPLTAPSAEPSDALLEGQVGLGSPPSLVLALPIPGHGTVSEEQATPPASSTHDAIPDPSPIIGQHAASTTVLVMSPVTPPSVPPQGPSWAEAAGSCTQAPSLPEHADMARAALPVSSPTTPSPKPAVLKRPTPPLLSPLAEHKDEYAVCGAHSPAVLGVAARLARCREQARQRLGSMSARRHQGKDCDTALAALLATLLKRRKQARASQSAEHRQEAYHEEVKQQDEDHTRLHHSTNNHTARGDTQEDEEGRLSILGGRELIRPSDLCMYRDLFVSSPLTGYNMHVWSCPVLCEQLDVEWLATQRGEQLRPRNQRILDNMQWLLTYDPASQRHHCGELPPPVAGRVLLPSQGVWRCLGKKWRSRYLFLDHVSTTMDSQHMHRDCGAHGRSGLED